MGGGGRYLISKEDSVWSSKRTRMQGGKAQVQEVRGHAAEDQKTNLNFQLVIKLSGSVHTKIYSRD